MMQAKVDLPYLKFEKDRNGNAVYCYFRHGKRRWRLPMPDEPGFAKAYERRRKFVEDMPKPAADNVAFLPKSFGWVIEQFIASDEYRARADTTKATDRPLLDYLKKKFGPGRFGDMTPKFVKQIRNDAKDEYGTARAKIVLGLISTVWKFAFEFLDMDDDLDANPTAGIDRLYKTQREHEPWPQEVLDAFEKAANPVLRLAFYLALYSGQRRSDVAAMQWTQYVKIDAKMWLRVRQQKTREYLEIPCHKILRAALEAQTDRTGHILKTFKGTEFKPRSLSEAFRVQLRELGIHGYSVHGLRKNAAVAMADAGCDDRMIMAVTGHSTTAMVSLYTRRANQKRRALRAIQKWERSGGKK